MTERNPHQHKATCRERAKFPSCGKVVHQHLRQACYDRDDRLTCRVPTDHRHTDACYGWLYNCGYPG